MAVSPWGPVGPPSPLEGTPPAHPGPLDADDAHTLHSTLPHTTPVGQEAENVRIWKLLKTPWFVEFGVRLFTYNENKKTSIETERITTSTAR